MTLLQPIRNVVARWHAGKGRDYLVLDYLELLDRDLSQLRATRRAALAGLTPSGWYVLRRVVGVAVLTVLLAVVVGGGVWTVRVVQEIRGERERAKLAVIPPEVLAKMQDKRERAARETQARYSAGNAVRVGIHGRP